MSLGPSGELVTGGASAKPEPRSDRTRDDGISRSPPKTQSNDYLACKHPSYHNQSLSEADCLSEHHIMPFLTTTSRLSATSFSHALRASAIPTRHYAGLTSDWEGRQPSEHTTNRDDDANVEVSASKSGAAERAAGSEGNSSATAQEDKGNHNKKAKEDHPEAPKPVIGMNDERGQVSGR